jgi:thiol-disulfide isomerase/thioredoxin
MHTVWQPAVQEGVGAIGGRAVPLAIARATPAGKRPRRPIPVCAQRVDERTSIVVRGWLQGTKRGATGTSCVRLARPGMADWVKTNKWALVRWKVNMLRRPLRSALLVAALAGTALVPGAATAQDVIGLPLGTQVQPVTLETIAGDAVDLGQWVGRKPVLIQFWATWCPTCAQLQPRLDAAHARYGEQVEFIAVAVAVNQTKRAVTRHLERHALPFRMIWDTQGRATRAFNAPATSFIVILDAAGRVAYTGLGASQDIEAAVASVAGTR